MKCEFCQCVLTQAEADRGNEAAEAIVGEGNNANTVCVECATSCLAATESN